MRKELSQWAAALTVIAVACVVLFCTEGMSAGWDSLNPAVRSRDDFAVLPQGQHYATDVVLVDGHGERRDYTVDLIAPDPSHSYAMVTHRGIYVQVVSYIEPEDMPAPARAALER
ncbi:hypothetical protein ACUY3K_03200 [Corynebacterium uberis]|uniref:hypothetical protein n=1 Tax=Corynebacterium TaxID=1716 RepID=UPI001D0A856A|nr:MULTISPECIES: hypothetical protein [Corynebacterium]MCZ9309722.1 hypothetical protein [Corynebacterium sp. c6VSa_13]UDL73526.1 hypothetical protein LH391_10685 [Corynebacterium uberis]UDL75594.1 hypothetical protein LH393_10240 [Corynebacterium uberis]UDL77807.1 hypothetical protein LH394_10225 [Corynebacterium uberis]UDL80090.1 hypothetical protein LH392_10645 [Corynebacterium uberis]